MIVSFCSALFDYVGDHLLDIDMNNSNLSALSRRVSRTATLDGGALIVDNGYAASDATFVLSVANITPEQHAALSATIKRHSQLTLSCIAGCFTGVVDNVDESQGFKIRFLVKSQANG